MVLSESLYGQSVSRFLDVSGRHLGLPEAARTAHLSPWYAAFGCSLLIAGQAAVQGDVQSAASASSRADEAQAPSVSIVNRS